MYIIEAKTHPINSHPQLTAAASSFSGARKIAKEFGNRDHIQDTLIRSQKTGRTWHQFWPMFVYACH